MAGVDVIVPCYKYGHFLRGCVESVLSQEAVDVRVLILDDASPDNTEEVGRQLAAEDLRVTFRRHAVNQGHINTYNEGIEWASAEYLLLLSADDVLTPGALGRAARLLDEHPEVGFTHGRDIRTTQPGVPPCPAPESYGWRVIPGQEFLERVCRMAENVVATPTAVVRTSLQKKLSGYRHDLPHTADLALWLRFAAHAPVGYIEASQAYYRLHHGNMFLQYAVAAHIRQLWTAFDLLFREDHERIRDWQKCCRLARHGLADQALWSASLAFESGDRHACLELLAAARELRPDIRSTPAWWRWQIKRAAGPRLTGVLRRLLTRLRGGVAKGVA
jgi:glycosyltransferase involved in cell wall biosynthesis